MKPIERRAGVVVGTILVAVLTVVGAATSCDPGARGGALASDAGPGAAVVGLTDAFGLTDANAEPIVCADGGALDLSFGDGGVVPLTPWGRVALLSDGHYGYAGFGAVVRLDPRGRVEWTTPPPRPQNSLAGLAAAPGGGVAISSWFGEVLDGGYRYTLDVAKLLADGGLDPAFGDSSIVSILEPDPIAFAAPLVVQPDGSVVVLVCNGQGAYHLARYRVDGQLDPSFGPDPTGAARGLSEQGAGSAEQLLSVGDGTFLVPSFNGTIRFTADGHVAGTVGPSGMASAVDDSNRFILARQPPVQIQRYSVTGGLDTAFGDGGSASLAKAGAIWDAVVVDPNGGTLFASFGDTTEGHVSGYTIQRLLPTGAPDTMFGNAGTLGLPDLSGLASPYIYGSPVADVALDPAGSCGPALMISGPTGLLRLRL